MNITLNVKPEWYAQINPEQKVPCLQFDDGRALNESLVVSEYLDDAYPDQNRLKPTDPYENSKQKLAIESFSKAITLYYKIVMSKEKISEEILSQFNSALRSFFTEYLTRDYVGGDMVRYADCKQIIKIAIFI